MTTIIILTIISTVLLIIAEMSKKLYIKDLIYAITIVSVLLLGIFTGIYTSENTYIKKYLRGEYTIEYVDHVKNGLIIKTDTLIINNK